MCLDPISMAVMGGSGALMAGGQLANARQQKKVIGARNNALADEQSRQAGYRTEAADAFDKALTGFDRPMQDAMLTKSVADRTASGEATMGEVDPGYAVTDSAPAMVKTELAKRMVEAVTKGRDDMKRRAKLSAFGDRQFMNGQNLTDSGTKIGTQASFAGGSAGVLPSELGAANALYDPTLGDILGGAGQIGMFAGLSGAPKKLSTFFKPRGVA